MWWKVLFFPCRMRWWKRGSLCRWWVIPKATQNMIRWLAWSLMNVICKNLQDKRLGKWVVVAIVHCKQSICILYIYNMYMFVSIYLAYSAKVWFVVKDRWFTTFGLVPSFSFLFGEANCASGMVGIWLSRHWPSSPQSLGMFWKASVGRFRCEFGCYHWYIAMVSWNIFGVLRETTVSLTALHVLFLFHFWIWKVDWEVFYCKAIRGLTTLLKARKKP